MFNQVSLQDWENLVKKQLKTDDIYAILTKDNLEGIAVSPYYTETSLQLSNLPRVEESMHLVASYQEALEDYAFAFLLKHNVEGLTDKKLFIENKELAEHIKTDDSNQYISLIDPFTDNGLDVQLAKELLGKAFERNICVDVSLHQNSGASIVQQLAIALSKAKDLVENLGKEVLPTLVFKIAVGSNYFFEIAKIRAFKLLFQALSKEFEVEEVPFIFVETTLRNKAKNDEENNLIRSTLELSSAMIAGADAVFANDFKLVENNTLSEEIAFKQQIVLAYESIINVFEDAANGSYYIEEITQQFAEKAWNLFLEIEEAGGYTTELQNGALAKKIYEHAVEEQKWVEEGKIKLIGVNLYPKLEKTKTIEQLYNPQEIKPVRWAEMFE